MPGRCSCTRVLASTVTIVARNVGHVLESIARRLARLEIRLDAFPVISFVALVIGSLIAQRIQVRPRCQSTKRTIGIPAHGIF